MSVYNMTGVVAFSGDTFRNNSAAADGGFLAVTGSPNVAVTVDNSTVTDNTVRLKSSCLSAVGSCRAHINNNRWQNLIQTP